MDVLPKHFRTLWFFGFWYETKEHWLVKYIWKPLTANCVIFFTIFQLAAILAYRDNVNDMTECLFVSLTYFAFSFKLFNFLSRRDAMMDLLKEFRREICQPKDDRERDIVRPYEKMSALVFNVYVGSAQVNGIVFALAPLMAIMAGDEELFYPFKTYEIYEKTNRGYFWLTYWFQVFTDEIGIFCNVTLDTLLGGFLLMICGQIDLCCHRFISSSNNEIRRSTRECIVHHTLICRTVQKVENFFMRVVLPFMSLSLIIFCTTIYNATQANVSGIDLISFFVYIICLLCQLGCYCWFGNELKLKSTTISDAIYNSDWTALKPLDRKNLYFIMLSCQKDMTVSFHGFCTLTMDIFVWVLKTSYGAYNLLKTVENNG